jgi:hypothetical protein
LAPSCCGLVAPHLPCSHTFDTHCAGRG